MSPERLGRDGPAARRAVDQFLVFQFVDEHACGQENLQPLGNKRFQLTGQRNTRRTHGAEVMFEMQPPHVSEGQVRPVFNGVTGNPFFNFGEDLPAADDRCFRSPMARAILRVQHIDAVKDLIISRRTERCVAFGLRRLENTHHLVTLRQLVDRPGQLP